MVAKKTAVQQSATGRSTGTGKAVKPASGATAGAAGAAAPKETATGKKSAAVRSAAAKKTAAEKAAAEKPAAKKAPAKKTAAKKTAAKKAVAEKAGTSPASGGAESPPEGKRTTKKAATKTATKTATKKTAAKKAGGATGRKSAKKTAEDADETAKTTGATTVVAKKTQGTATAAQQPGAVPKARASAAEPGELAVRPGEDPWTADEVAEARAELQSEALRLGSEIASAEEGLAGLMRDSGDGAGDDDADTGTKNITREHEMALAANAREMLLQTERAL
ncbi:TraR/DksA family transcriptional regulator, partial [Streptomyces sp. SID5785]|uniref:TraR/DksA family transcriptional regulator n=1 Tax=Streptomyces sp. SID5785 TaxID=2690309 RepID=UPI001361CFEE